MNINKINQMKFSTENFRNTPNISKSHDINNIKKFEEQNNELTNIQEKLSKTQSRMDIQSVVDMCSKKLEFDPTHKKALLLTASSYIKNKDFDNVNKIN